MEDNKKKLNGGTGPTRNSGGKNGRYGSTSGAGQAGSSTGTTSSTGTGTNSAAGDESYFGSTGRKNKGGGTSAV